jgi:hypothetical protein
VSEVIIAKEVGKGAYITGKCTVEFTPSDVNPASGCWHHVEVGHVADISEYSTASIIRLEVRNVRM